MWDYRSSICYQGRVGPDRVLDVHGFVDVDWSGDLDQRRSTSGYVFSLFGGAISWMSKKLAVVTYQLQKLNTWQPLMQVKRLYGCRDCVQNLDSNNKLRG